MPLDARAVDSGADQPGHRAARSAASTAGSPGPERSSWPAGVVPAAARPIPA